jgi:hypothetical protein
MIRTTKEAIAAYEIRTGFVGIGAFLINRGVVVITQDTPSGNTTHKQKILPVGGHA